MNILDWLELLSTLSIEEKEQLALFCQEKEVKTWEKVFCEWDDANAMYILKTGEIEVYTWGDLNKRVLWVIHAEEVLWEMALFVGSRTRMASAIALDDTKLITILDFSIRQLVDSHPQLLDKIKIIIAQRKQNNQILDNQIKDI